MNFICNKVKILYIMGDCMDSVLLSTGKDNWETPSDFYNKLNEEFGFDLDPCCNEKNKKCKNYFTSEQDGLKQDWGGYTVFCNPPYSKSGKQDEWVKKCYEESKKDGTTVVALLPARTDTKRFHKYIWNGNCSEIRFIEGRLFFELDGKPVVGKNGKPMPAPFPSMIVIWGKK